MELRVSPERNLIDQVPACNHAVFNAAWGVLPPHIGFDPWLSLNITIPGEPCKLIDWGPHLGLVRIFHRH